MTQQRRVVAPERAGWGGRRRSGGGSAAVTRAVQRARMRAARRRSQPSQLAERQPSPRRPQAGDGHAAPLRPLEGAPDGSAQYTRGQDSRGKIGLRLHARSLGGGGSGGRQRRQRAPEPAMLLSSRLLASKPRQLPLCMCTRAIACWPAGQKLVQGGGRIPAPPGGWPLAQARSCSHASTLTGSPMRALHFNGAVDTTSPG